MRGYRRQSGFGWMELIIGILLIVLGIMSIARPNTVATWAVVVYGLLALVTGIEDIVFYCKMSEHTGFGPTVSLVTGVISIMVGAMLLLYPDAGTWIVSILFPIWFIAHCISRLSHLNVVRFTAGSGYSIVSLVLNIMGLIMGIMMLFSPWISILSFGYIIGFYLILLGIDNIVTAFSKMGRDW